MLDRNRLPLSQDKTAAIPVRQFLFFLKIPAPSTTGSANVFTFPVFSYDCSEVHGIGWWWPMNINTPLLLNVYVDFPPSCRPCGYSFETLVSRELEASLSEFLEQRTGIADWALAADGRIDDELNGWWITMLIHDHTRPMPKLSEIAARDIAEAAKEAVDSMLRKHDTSPLSLSGRASVLSLTPSPTRYAT